MNDQELKTIAEKIVEKTATKEETLLFITECNALLETLKEELKK